MTVEVIRIKICLEQYCFWITWVKIVCSRESTRNIDGTVQKKQLIPRSKEAEVLYRDDDTAVQQLGEKKTLEKLRRRFFRVNLKCEGHIVTEDLLFVLAAMDRNGDQALRCSNTSRRNKYILMTMEISPDKSMYMLYFESALLQDICKTLDVRKTRKILLHS